MYRLLGCTIVYRLWGCATVYRLQGGLASAVFEPVLVSTVLDCMRILPVGLWGPRPRQDVVRTLSRAVSVGMGAVMFSLG